MRLMIFCLALLAFCAVPANAATSNKGWIGGKVFAFAPDNNTEATIEVKPLDDPGNPYKDQYSAVDRWTYQNYNRNVTPENQGDWQLGLSQAQGFHPLLGWMFIPEVPVDYSGGLALTTAVVDENGYVIPAFDSLREVEMQGGHPPKSLRTEIEKAKAPYIPKHARFWALGRWNTDVEQASNDARDRYLATAYPAIPQWAAALDHDLILLPDGGVVVIADTPTAQTRIAQRYAADGTLLKEAPVADRRDWHGVVATTADPKASPYYKLTELPMPAGFPAHQVDNIEHVGGRYDVLRGDDGKVAAVVDYWQDKELDVVANPAALDDLKVEWDYFQRLGKTQVKAVFAAQQRLGSQHKQQ